MKWIRFFPICLLCTGCGSIYNTSFDCPPGKGIGCTPVNEVLDLIVEREGEEDLFVTNRGTALLLKQQEVQIIPTKSLASPKKKVKLHLVQQASGTLLLVDEELP